jgi:MoaA/NifB/PqqE/SkfB family radical SAM enzyme
MTEPNWSEEITKFVQTADKLFNTGDFQGAAGYIQQGLDLAPDDLFLIQTYGNLLLRLNDLNGAYQQFKKETIFYPDSSNGYVNLAVVLILLGDEDAANEIINYVTSRFPNNPDVIDLIQQIHLLNQNKKLTAKENAELNKKEKNAGKIILDSTALNLEIATTTVCNIIPPCVMCAKHVDPNLGYLRKDSRHIPEEIYQKLSRFIPRSKKISLHGIGEPLTCPYLFEPVQSIDPNEVMVQFCSNGILLNDINIQAVLDHNISLIDFSLDAATPETYQKIRHNDFNKVIQNIRNLIEERDRRGQTIPAIQINMCLMRENVGDVPEFVRLAKSLGASAHIFHMNYGYSYKYDWFDYENQHCELDPINHDRNIEEGFRLAKELHVNLMMSGKRSLVNMEDKSDYVYYNSNKSTSNSFYCSRPWDSLLITTDGYVYNCCYQNEPIGSLEQSSIDEIWNGPMLQSIRASTSQHKPHENCVNHAGSICPFLQRI